MKIISSFIIIAILIPVLSGVYFAISLSIRNRSNMSYVVTYLSSPPIYAVFNRNEDKQHSTYYFILPTKQNLSTTSSGIAGPVNLLTMVQNFATTSASSTKATSTLNSSGSLIDFLKSQKMESSMKARKILAAKFGIKKYSGTRSENERLLKILKNDSLLVKNY